jgi:GcrA cell cycle regulator
MKRFTIFPAAYDIHVAPEAMPKTIHPKNLAQARAAGWTDERIEALKELWAAGLSCSQIACRLGGVSRNAVIGKVHRLGLSGRVTTVRKVRIGPTRRERAHCNKMHALIWGRAALSPLRQAMTTTPLPEPAPDDIARVSFLDLDESSCKWIPGNPLTTKPHEPQFCGLKRIEGQPYCLDHCKRAFRLPEIDSRSQPAPANPKTFDAFEKELA